MKKHKLIVLDATQDHLEELGYEALPLEAIEEFGKDYIVLKQKEPVPVGLNIKLKPYHWTCGEPGCCSEWGVHAEVNGEDLGQSFSSEDNALRYILETYYGAKIEDGDYE